MKNPWFRVRFLKMYPRKIASVVIAMRMARDVLSMMERKSGDNLYVKPKRNPGASMTRM